MLQERIRLLDDKQMKLALPCYAPVLALVSWYISSVAAALPTAFRKRKDLILFFVKPWRSCVFPLCLTMRGLNVPCRSSSEALVFRLLGLRLWLLSWVQFKVLYHLSAVS